MPTAARDDEYGCTALTHHASFYALLLTLFLSPPRPRRLFVLCAGDCANFVSQSLLAGNHTALVKSPCRGYPCGQEEVGAAKLATCLAANYGWTSTCGKFQTPPTNIVEGDVLVFRGSSCTDTEAHATIVTNVVSSTDVRITCHSEDAQDKPYTDFASEFGYFDWLHFEG